jgi:integrase
MQDSQGNAYVVIERDKNGDPVYKSLHGSVREMIEDRITKCRFPGDYLLPGPLDGNAHSSIRKYFKKAVLKAAKKNPNLNLEWGATRNGVTFHTLRHYAEFRIMPNCRLGASLGWVDLGLHSA